MIWVLSFVYCVESTDVGKQPVGVLWGVTKEHQNLHTSTSRAILSWQFKWLYILIDSNMRRAFGHGILKNLASSIAWWVDAEYNRAPHNTTILHSTHFANVFLPKYLASQSLSHFHDQKSKGKVQCREIVMQWDRRDPFPVELMPCL